MTVAAVKLGKKKESIFIDKVKALLPEGGNLNLCLTCGACASGCPATGLEGMDPRKFLRMAALGMDEEITNVNGGAIALGHPLGCTGAKLTTQLIYEMKRRDIQFGLVTMCIGGGMGAAGIFENIN